MKEEVEKEELFIPKTKHKGLKICLAIILIAGLIVGGYFLYQYKFNNSKTIITNALEEAKGNIKEAFKEVASNKKYKLDGHIKIDSNIDDETFQLLKDIELQLSGEMDLDESISNYQINTKYKNDKLMDISFYQEKNDVYLLLEGLYDKYIKIDANEQTQNLPTNIPKININPDDMKTIMNAIITSLEEEINKLEITKADATINIDGKDINVLNNYVEFKDKELNSFVKSIVTNLKNNQEFVNAINRITNADVKSSLDELIKGIDEEEFKGVYKINFYTDKGLFNKKLISVRQTITQDGITMSINVDKISDDEIIISLSTIGLSYSIKMKKNNSAINMLVGINVMGQYINVDINMNYDEIKEVNKVDVSNYKNASELTEEEIEEISKKTMDNKALLQLMEEIDKVTKKEA